MSLNFRSLHNLYLSRIQERQEIHNDILRLQEITEITKKQSLELKKLQASLKEEKFNLVDKNDYMLDVFPLIEKVEEGSDINDHEYREFCQKYFPEDIRELTGKRKKTEPTMQRCCYCSSILSTTDTKADTTICQNCGTCTAANQQIPSWEKIISIRPRKSKYAKAKSLMEYLDYMQLRKKQKIEESAIQELKKKMRHIPPNNLDVKTVKTAMQQLGLSKFYTDKFYVFYLITGKKVCLSKETEEQIHSLFYLEQFAFNYLQQSQIIDRKNIFLYGFSVFKLVELILFKLKNPEVAAYLLTTAHPNAPKQSAKAGDVSEVVKEELEFLLAIIPVPVVEADHNLEKYDVKWKCICGFLGWKFIPSL